MAALAIPKGSLVLVTGANGFIASHIVDQSLASGYRVRGTVRSLEKADWMVELFNKRYGPSTFEPVVVADMSSEAAFDSVMEGCDGVVHAASDLTFGPDPNKVIPGVIAGVTNALKAAAKHKSVKRFVYTSSSTALTMPKPNVKFSIDRSSWNHESIDLAWAPPPYTPDRGFPVYAASKTQAEQACWEFMEKEKPRFVLNCVCPNMNLGTILSEKQGGSTAGAIKGAWANDEKAVGMMKMFGPQWMIDVVDDARLHVAGFMYEDVKDERLLGFADTINFNKVVKTFRELDGERKLPELLEGEEEDISTVDTTRSVELLKRWGQDGWTDFQTSVKRNVGLV